MDWIWAALFAYRTRIDTSTGCRRFEHMFGRKAKGFLDRRTSRNDDKIASVYPRAFEVGRWMENSLAKAIEKSKTAQRRRMEIQNKSHGVSEAWPVGTILVDTRLSR